MIRDILARFLEIKSYEADALIEIIKREKCCEKADILKIETQADLISYLQKIAQDKWFLGHDRSKFPANGKDATTQDAYYQLFEKFGLCSARQYDFHQQGQPQLMVVLGSSESQVRERVLMLKTDLLRGVLPTKNKIIGLGCNRELGRSVNEMEKESREKLKLYGAKPTEMDMVSFLINEMLQELKSTHSQFAELSYQAINTYSKITSRSNRACVTTKDTAILLKTIIENDENYQHFKKPLMMIAYSKQPYIERQRRDIEKVFADQHLYKVFGAGLSLSKEEFTAIPNSINRCLGEIARLININFMSQKLTAFDTALTKDEKEMLLILS